MRLIHFHCTCINIGIVVSAVDLLETTGEQMIMDALLCQALDTVTYFKEEKYQEIPFMGKNVTLHPKHKSTKTWAKQS